MSKTLNFPRLGLIGCGWLLVLSGCAGCDEDLSGQPPAGVGGASSGQSAGGQGTGGMIFSTGGSGQGGGEPCAQQSADASIVNRPVDIIFVIDNSGSMSAEIQEVEEQINSNFAAIIDNADPPIDYRVVMVSQFGNSGSQRICIAAPLGGIPDNDMDGHCDSIPSEPVNTSKFFHHSVFISSYNGLCRFVQQFSTGDGFGLQPNGYQDVLRDDSFKFLAVITDDRSSTGQQNGCTSPLYDDLNTVAGGQTVAAQFDADLMALSPLHFGADPMDRNYSFWSIVALAPFSPTSMLPYGDPHPPDETVAPVTTAECTPSAQNSGTGYQALSILTGGYRYPTCGLDYTAIFQLMAEGVILGAQAPCEFDIPEPPAGQTLDLSTVEVSYNSDGTPVGTFDQVATLGDCTPTSFYIDMDKIILCPDACTTVQADEKAELKVLYGCSSDID
jgi:hypothetical protein